MLQLFGNSSFFQKKIGKRIKHETVNLSAAKLIGGKSDKPSLMKIQVDPQIMHNKTQTIKGFIYLKLIPFEYLFFDINCLGRAEFLGNQTFYRELSPE